MRLIDYIQQHYGGNQSAFARAMGVPRQQVTRWLVGEWIVYNGRLYSPFRPVPIIHAAAV
jgi:hypothetical protein